MDVGFEVTDHRFDQKNEMFKRFVWDPEFEKWSRRFYAEVVYKGRPGWRKPDYALRNAAWNIEWGFAMGNSASGHGLYGWEGVVPKAERFAAEGGPVSGSPRRMAHLVKTAARRLGAGLVGIAPVHPTWVYSHEYNLIDRTHRQLELPPGIEAAVVMAIPMDYETMRNQAMVLQGVTTGLGYSLMAVTANLVAAFIRTLGYRALPSGNDTALSVPLALAAGLGEWSRMGLLVTEKYGPRVRICKVFTDLPLEYDSYRPFGVVKFCNVCKTCAVHCPSQAIPHGGMTTRGPNISSHSGVRKWYVDCEKCFTYWAIRRADCTQCIRVCPFNKPPARWHDLTRWLIKRVPSLNRTILWADRRLGFQRPYPTDRFWRG